MHESLSVTQFVRMIMPLSLIISIVDFPERSPPLSAAAAAAAAAAEGMMLQKLPQDRSSHVKQLSLEATPYARSSPCYYQDLCTIFFNTLGLNGMYHYITAHLYQI